MNRYLRTERQIVTAALIGLWVAWFSPQFLSTGIPFRRDTLLLYLPIRQFLHEQLRSFRLPQWFPYEGLGVPFIGQFVTATFHPETWLFLPFPAPIALKLNILCAYLLGLGGAYRFARSFDLPRAAAACGAAALAFSGYALSMSDNLPFLMGVATLPWVGWAAMRLTRKERPRDIALLGLLWGLVLLGGDVQGFVAGGAIVLAVHIVQQASFFAWMTSGAGLLLGLGVAAIELLPARTVFNASARLKSGFAFDPASYWALPLKRLPELLLPRYLPASARIETRNLLFGEGFQWAATIFAGGIVIVLAVAGIRRRRRHFVFFLLAVLALWIATGKNGYLLPAAWKVIPPLQSFRFPEKYVGLFTVALVPLVALGAGWVLQSPERRCAVFLVGAAIVFGLSLEVHTESFQRLLAQRNLDGDRDLADLITRTWRTSLRETSGAMAIAGLVLWLLRSSRWSRVALPLMLSGELWLANHDALPLASGALLNPPHAAFEQDIVRSTEHPPLRLLSLARGRPETADDRDARERWVRGTLARLPADVSGLFHASTIGLSALPAQSERTKAVFGRLAVRAPTLGPLFSGCLRIVDDKVQGITPAHIIDRSVLDELVLAPVECRPSAYFAAMRTEIGLEHLADALGELHQDEALWEEAPVAAPHSADVEWKSWSPGRLGLTAEASEFGVLVINEGYSEGWRAWIDGQPESIVPVNGIAMGIEVPRGKHEVDFRYRTPHLKLGAAISFATLIVCLIMIYMGRKRLTTASAGAQDVQYSEDRWPESIEQRW